MKTYIINIIVVSLVFLAGIVSAVICNLIGRMEKWLQTTDGLLT